MYKSIDIKVTPNQCIAKAAKVLKVSQGEVVAALLTSYILRLKTEKSNEKIKSRK